MFVANKHFFQRSALEMHPLCMDALNRDVQRSGFTVLVKQLKVHEAIFEKRFRTMSQTHFQPISSRGGCIVMISRRVLNLSVQDGY